MLRSLSKIFGLAVKTRNKRFDNGKIKTYSLDIPVISVGNISVGGTGKTPFTIYLAEYLKSIGKRPGIVGSGYGRKSKGYYLVSDGTNIDYDTNKLGDEMVLIADKTKVPVAIDNKKWKAARMLSEQSDIDCLIIDDGFQHRYLKRDLDIVLVDKKSHEDKFLLPAGRLREPQENLERADLIFYRDDVTNHENKVCSYRTNNVKIENKQGSDWDNNKVVLLSSIAKPERFIESVKELQIQYFHTFINKDHYLYNLRDVRSMISKVKKLDLDSILTTEKDYVKLYLFLSLFQEEKVNLYTLNIEIEIISGLNLLNEKLNEIF